MTEVTGVSPGRVNLIGEHTDYNDGFVLPVALDKVARVTASHRVDGGVRITSAQKDETVEHATLQPTDGVWWGYVAGVIWALRERGHDVGGVDLLLDSDVPLGGGLSSSAALECATALAVDALAGLGLSPTELAEVAQAAENDFVGVPTGPMDQRASLWCTTDHALLLDCRTLQARQVPFALPDDLALALIDTRSPHVLADGHYAVRRAACAEASRTLGVPALRDVSIDDLDAALARLDPVQARRVRHVVTENARVLRATEALDAHDWTAFGALMTESHASMRDDYEITVPTVDLAVEVALAEGALGARMTGGGFGGTVLALVSTASLGALSDALDAAYAAHGFETPGLGTTRAGAGGVQLSRG